MPSGFRAHWIYGTFPRRTEICGLEGQGEFPSGTVNHDLANDGVGYATSGGFVDDIRELIEGPKAFIVRNLFDVPTVPVKGCREPQTYNLRY